MESSARISGHVGNCRFKHRLCRDHLLGVQGVACTHACKWDKRFDEPRKVLERATRKEASVFTHVRPELLSASLL